MSPLDNYHSMPRFPQLRAWKTNPSWNLLPPPPPCPAPPTPQSSHAATNCSSHPSNWHCSSPSWNWWSPCASYRLRRTPVVCRRGLWTCRTGRCDRSLPLALLLDPARRPPAPRSSSYLSSCSEHTAPTPPISRSPQLPLLAAPCLWSCPEWRPRTRFAVGWGGRLFRGSWSSRRRRCLIESGLLLRHFGHFLFEAHPQHNSSIFGPHRSQSSWSGSDSALLLGWPRIDCRSLGRNCSRATLRLESHFQVSFSYSTTGYFLKQAQTWVLQKFAASTSSSAYQQNWARPESRQKSWTVWAEFARCRGGRRASTVSWRIGAGNPHTHPSPKTP